MRRSALPLSVAALALVFAACGGDDSDSVLDRVGAPADTSDDGETATSDEPDTGGPGLPVPTDAGELQDRLAELGIDLDELGDLGDLDLDDLDLEELFGDLDDFVSGFGGDGGGVVTVAGVRYEMTSDSCLSFGTDFFIDGPAQGADGTVAWIDANRSVSTRDDLREFMDDAMLDRMFGDADQIDELFIDVRVGATGRFDFNDDQPNWTATSDSGFVFGDGIVEFEMVGNGVRGAGEATDSNAVAADFGETVPIEFDLACN